jgi:putative transport protein
MRHLFAALATQPFTILFLVIAIGYLVGGLKIKGIGLGATASTLIVGLVVSVIAAQVGVKLELPELAGTIFFNLFMFSVGMKVGPQFLVGLRRDAKHFIAIGVFIPIVSLGLIFAFRELFTLSPGLVPGIFAGANTATPGLGAASAALSAHGATLADGYASDAAIANMSTAFAFSYCISVVLFTVFAKLPDMLGRNTAEAARELEDAMTGPNAAPLPGSADEFLVGRIPVSVRAYTVERPEAIGHRIDEIRQLYPLLSIERVLRAGKVLEPVDDLVIEANDTLALHGRLPALVNAGNRLGPESYDDEALDLQSQTVDIVVHHEPLAGHSLLELAGSVGHGLYLNAMFRGGEPIPYGPETIVRNGDVVRVTGSAWRIERLARQHGNVVKPSITTDIATLAFSAALGALVGWITIPLGSIKLQIGSAVGLLLVGMLVSILRTRNPAFGGPYPEPARQLIEDLGLNVFVAVLGLNAGFGVLAAVGAGAVGPIILGTLVVGFVPPALAWVLGRKLFHMNEALLLGAVAGGRCNSPGLRAAIETTKSAVPAISYPATFAISNILLTVFCYVMGLLE